MTPLSRQLSEFEFHAEMTDISPRFAISIPTTCFALFNEIPPSRCSWSKTTSITQAEYSHRRRGGVSANLRAGVEVAIERR